MRVAVSGASGFVGSALSAALRERGLSVTRLVRSAEEHEQSPQNTLLWEPLGQGLQQPQALNGYDCFFHLAGRSIASRRWTKAEKARIRSSRVDATQILSRQLAELSEPPRVVVSASAIGIYGDRGHEEIDEASPVADGFLAEVAYEWEQACLPLVDAGCRVAHPRLGVVLGKDAGALRAMLPVFKLGLGGRIGSGKQYFSWISLTDCVRALMWFFEQPGASGVYNLVSPQPVRNLEFAESLAKSMSRPAWIPVPAFAVRALLGSEMADGLLLNSQRVVPRRLLGQGFQFENADLSGVFANL